MTHVVLAQKKLHTFKGIVGYYMKDQGQPRFKFFAHNISQDDFQAKEALFSSMANQML